MNYVINTQQKIVFNLEMKDGGLNEFMNQLNNHQLTAVSISNIGLHKRNILSVPPAEPYTEKGPGVYQLNTTDGARYFVKFEEGDSVAKIIERINDRQQQFVKIGDEETAVIIQSQNFDFIIEVATTEE